MRARACACMGSRRQWIKWAFFLLLVSFAPAINVWVRALWESELLSKFTVRARDHVRHPQGSAPRGRMKQPPPPDMKRLAVIILCRESDVGELAMTLRSFHTAYLGVNSNGTQVVPKRAHDVVVFSEVPWSEGAKELLRAESPVPVLFDILDDDSWSTPEWINETQFSSVLTAKSYYGNTESYRRMCRFFAGPAWTRPLLQQYTWVWRLDSHVRYLCDLVDDPVSRMESTGSVYGYALAMTELMYTIPTLWHTIMQYGVESGLDANVRTEWGLDPHNPSVKGCHYWTNMEIGRVEFFSGKAYQDLFHYLDRSGGFFYERWGDAPIRTWALLLLSKPSAVQWFDIGYQHPWWVKCPSDGTCPGRAACEPDPHIKPHNPTDGRMCKVGE